MAGARAAARRETSPIVLDSGAVIALARGKISIRRMINRAVPRASSYLVPAVVVAETIRGSGPRDATVERVLSKAGGLPVADETVARLAGRLLANAGSDSTIDAIVVANALQAGAGVIVTSDPDDLRNLVPQGSAVEIHAV